MFESNNLIGIEDINIVNNTNLDNSLHDILKYLRAITKADAGTIYLKDTNNNLRFTIFQNDTFSENISNELKSEIINIKHPIDEDNNTIAIQSYIKSEIISIDDLYNNNDFDFTSAKDFDTVFSYTTKSILTAPLLDFFTKEKIGVLQLINKKDSNDKYLSFTQEDISFIELSSYLTTLSINSTKEYLNSLYKVNQELEEKVRKRTKDLESAHKDLINQANKDPLTDLYNRRYFNHIIENLIQISKRESLPLSILIIDIDNFKNVNDTYGHDIGDIVIKRLASILNNLLRSSDIAVRFGGDEFVIVLPNTSTPNSCILANKLITEVNNSKLKTSNKCEKGLLYDINFTVSIGSALVEKEDNDIENTLHKADKALYKSKKQGKNQVSTI